jgi:hypothetical protein
MAILTIANEICEPVDDLSAKSLSSGVVTRPVVALLEPSAMAASLPLPRVQQTSSAVIHPPEFMSTRPSHRCRGDLCGGTWRTSVMDFYAVRVDPGFTPSTVIKRGSPKPYMFWISPGDAGVHLLPM